MLNLKLINKPFKIVKAAGKTPIFSKMLNAFKFATLQNMAKGKKMAATRQPNQTRALGCPNQTAPTQTSVTCTTNLTRLDKSSIAHAVMYVGIIMLFILILQEKKNSLSLSLSHTHTNLQMAESRDLYV